MAPEADLQQAADCPAVGPGAAGAVGVGGRTVVATRPLRPTVLLGHGAASSAVSRSRPRDVVQDTLSHTFARFTSFRSTQARALRIYLRRAVENRIRDELRRATRRQSAVLPDEPVRASDAASPQLRELIDEESWRRYLDALQRLPDRDRRLVVARAELGCSSEQLAFLERLSSPAVARVALRRALIRLGNLMSDA